MHIPHARRLRFVVLTGLAVGAWAVAAVHGYAWQLLWLPAVVAGASWPRRTTSAPGRCLRKLRRDAGRTLDNR